MKNVVIRTENLSFRNLIKYDDIKILREQCTFICGESGSGKSSLLKIINGTVSPSSGAVYYNEKDISGMDSLLLRREVMLLSQSSFLFDLSISENFDKYYEYREAKPISEAEKKSFMKLCAADFPLNSLCQTLSGGERQRTFLAIGLSFKPSVLLLDEPTSALDEQTSRRLFTQLQNYSRTERMTMVVVSHDRALAKIFGDQFIALKEGACG